MKERLCNKQSYEFIFCDVKLKLYKQIIFIISQM
jgi:hypothetical protein